MAGNQAYDFIRSKPRAWRFARPAQDDPRIGASMAAEGRTQAINGSYMTRPGAPMSPRDATPPTPGVSGGFTDASTWNNFFISHEPKSAAATPDAAWAKPSAWNSRGPNLAPQNPSAVGDIAPPDNDPSWAATARPDPSNPRSYLDAAQASQDKYFNGLGQPIARPRPGAVQPGTSIQTPYGPAIQNPKIPPLPTADSLAPVDSYAWPDMSSDFSTDLPT